MHKFTIGTAIWREGDDPERLALDVPTTKAEIEAMSVADLKGVLNALEGSRYVIDLLVNNILEQVDWCLTRDPTLDRDEEIDIDYAVFAGEFHAGLHGTGRKMRADGRTVWRGRDPENDYGEVVD